MASALIPLQYQQGEASLILTLIQLYFACELNFQLVFFDQEGHGLLKELGMPFKAGSVN